MSNIGCNKCDRSFVDVTNEREACPKYWIAMLVQMNTEKKTSEKLTKLGIRNYVPTQTEIHQWSDRKKRIEKVVIPMVVFAYVNKRVEQEIKSYSFVYKLLSYPGQSEAAIIPEEQIDRLKFMLSNADSKVKVAETVFELGEKIEIVRGPLKGLCGELCYVEDRKPMVGVYLNLFGYICVEISKNDIGKI